MDEDSGDELADIETMNYDNLDSVFKLQKTQRYIDIMQKLDDALKKESYMTCNNTNILEDDPKYQLIVDTGALSVDIENEIIIVHNFIKDNYRLMFPELESLIHHPIDYVRAVKKIGNEMVVSVTASTTSGKPLSEENLMKTIDACNRALDFDLAKRKVLDFVESIMGTIAPNLSYIVGTEVAAKLMGTAGGLSALTRMPACNLQILGSKRKHRVGFIEQTEIFQSTPPPLRTRALRLIALKATLVARVDVNRSDPTGIFGRKVLEQIRKKIEKWQEAPPPKQPKPLTVLDSDTKKKRGGRRLQKKALAEVPVVCVGNAVSLSSTLQMASNMSSSSPNVSTGLSIAETLAQAPFKACTASLSSRDNERHNELSLTPQYTEVKQIVNSSEKSKHRISKNSDTISPKVGTPQPSSDNLKTCMSGNFHVLSREGTSSNNTKKVPTLSSRVTVSSNDSKLKGNGIGVEKDKNPLSQSQEQEQGTALPASNSDMMYCTVAVQGNKDAYDVEPEFEALAAPDGEEKAFLESLGWNPDTVEDALTAEEIESFVKKVSHLF